ncbi:SDR family oxidoreductase [Mesorhizobium sp. M7D.F.Ca.US.005.01.1.1]|uniref:SDR family oxidoreductase n=1 Tax=Mesorhizobium sp. M7D.F.Ca.US.005.01.1.1 TaxID=2493678 RepID=UPI000F75F14A|nr:SDR family oxidoreductase [Mesorhizobium sp. M7D.F.Ca.US.005.01.1.1]AZO44694.1 SDR family oxidoreductase [Mesorhizobium sp. M7D.F.Ca.US.005.01.1.1]
MAKTWFITGTSSGFGRLLTERLLVRGDRVAATARRPQALADLKAHHSDHLWIASLQMTDSDAIKATIGKAFDDLGHIDVIVSNAGYGLFGAAEELDDNQIRDLIDTNLVGSIQVIRAALPHLRKQHGGRILQVSSEGGQMAYPGFSLYHATKWGIEGFVESVRQEVASFGIGLTLVEPGPTQTNFGASLISSQSEEIYANTPVGDLRKAFAEGSFDVKGDPHKMVEAMIASVEQNPAPRRLTFGAAAYASIRSALQGRLTELENQKDAALAMDIDP